MADEIVALAGGIGAARFLEGLVAVVPPEQVIIIGNTGDDLELHGLHISPDLDTVAYTLSGQVNAEPGWGIAGDTFTCLDALSRFTSETWFRLGDRDLATHLFRTELLRGGVPLSEATRRIAEALGVRAKRLLPATDQPCRTRVQTDAGLLDFQVYFVKRRAEDAVLGISYDGCDRARPAPGVLEAIRDAAAVIVCPSNPLISIGPILAVPGIRETLAATPARVAAISPIVGGRAIKGPAAKMMRSMGLQPSAWQVAELYHDFLDVFILDHVDEPEAGRIEAMGISTASTDTIMRDQQAKISLALATLRALERGPGSSPDHS